MLAKFQDKFLKINTKFFLFSRIKEPNDDDVETPSPQHARHISPFKYIYISTTATHIRLSCLCVCGSPFFLSSPSPSLSFPSPYSLPIHSPPERADIHTHAHNSTTLFQPYTQLLTFYQNNHTHDGMQKLFLKGLPGHKKSNIFLCFS